MICEKLLVSCKTTEKTSYRLTQKDWHETIRDSFQEDKFPVMALDIKGTELYVIDAELFSVLVGFVNELP